MRTSCCRFPISFRAITSSTSPRWPCRSYTFRVPPSAAAVSIFQSSQVFASWLFFSLSWPGPPFRPPSALIHIILFCVSQWTSSDSPPSGAGDMESACPLARSIESGHTEEKKNPQSITDLGRELAAIYFWNTLTPRLRGRHIGRCHFWGKGLCIHLLAPLDVPKHTQKRIEFNPFSFSPSVYPATRIMYNQ